MTGDISRLHQLLPGAAFFMEHYPVHPDGFRMGMASANLEVGCELGCFTTLRMST